MIEYVSAENPELHVVNIQPGVVDTDPSRSRVTTQVLGALH
jgi:hypothetical protein